MSFEIIEASKIQPKFTCKVEYFGNESTLTVIGPKIEIFRTGNLFPKVIDIRTIKKVRLSKEKRRIVKFIKYLSNLVQYLLLLIMGFLSLYGSVNILLGIVTFIGILVLFMKVPDNYLELTVSFYKTEKIFGKRSDLILLSEQIFHKRFENRTVTQNEPNVESVKLIPWTKKYIV